MSDMIFWCDIEDGITKASENPVDPFWAKAIDVHVATSITIKKLRLQIRTLAGVALHTSTITKCRQSAERNTSANWHLKHIEVGHLPD
jgi:hypothetical protein